jgi:hypothetical protein
VEKKLEITRMLNTNVSFFILFKLGFHPFNMHIPKKDIVKFFIKETLLHQKVHSQRELTNIINSKLKMGDYSVSGKRIRSIALEIPGIRIRVDTRKGKPPEESCPVCENTLRKIYTKNLAGNKLLLRMQCDGCGYVGKGNNWVPKKYMFEYGSLLPDNG